MTIKPGVANRFPGFLKIRTRCISLIIKNLENVHPDHIRTADVQKKSDLLVEDDSNFPLPSVFDDTAFAK